MKTSLPIAGAPHAPAPLSRAAAGTDSWQSWRWQLRNMITSAEQIAQIVTLSDEERAGLARSKGRFRFGLTPYYASLMDPENPACPIRMQAIPRPQELSVAPGELVDPLGEDTHRPVASIFHKYPDRVLLYAVDRCAIYCRHCNRRRIVGGDDPPTTAELDEAIDYIARTPRIRDVLISGGDPLLLSTRKLASLLSRLRAIPHVEIIRIGTRLPVVLPQRIDDDLCRVLRAHAPLYINTHFNHPKEVTADSRQACERLVDHGIPVGNQAVLLRGINSSVRCLRALFRALLKMRVRPYYLFQGDVVVGTDHLRTSVDTAIELYRGLRGWMSGMAIPHLVIDAPGGGGKIAIGPETIAFRDEKSVTVRSYRGELIAYPEPRVKDPTVAYDEIYFAGVKEDDDREDGAEPLVE